MADDIPSDLFYTKDHEWARIDGNQATIGITKFAADQLGDVTMVELPDEGDSVTKGQVFGTVESVKSVSDLFAPVDGKVAKVNDPLGDSPEYVNEDPYDEGWMIVIELANPDDRDELMSAEQYAALVAEQE